MHRGVTGPCRVTARNRAGEACIPAAAAEARCRQLPQIAVVDDPGRFVALMGLGLIHLWGRSLSRSQARSKLLEGADPPVVFLLQTRRLSPAVKVEKGRGCYPARTDRRTSLFDRFGSGLPNDEASIRNQSSAFSSLQTCHIQMNGCVSRSRSDPKSAARIFFRST